eukprot:TRINITY_DN5385_c0_g1_i11.p1 TRINITY_DN5385_c0_g1~~TRINITY_DN5385_c0_g1_i11.p1  ORF type:complete len:212 (+),score=48.10 TRINITY_DN5385_c0_g1_i11:47-682(+)
MAQNQKVHKFQITIGKIVCDVTVEKQTENKIEIKLSKESVVDHDWKFVGTPAEFVNVDSEWQRFPSIDEIFELVEMSSKNVTGSEDQDVVVLRFNYELMKRSRSVQVRLERGDIFSDGQLKEFVKAQLALAKPQVFEVVQFFSQIFENIGKASVKEGSFTKQWYQRRVREEKINVVETHRQDSNEFNTPTTVEVFTSRTKDSIQVGQSITF